MSLPTAIVLKPYLTKDKEMYMFPTIAKSLKMRENDEMY